MLDSTLNVKYEKDAEKQYAVLEGQETEEYGMKMLQNNKMQGMLEVQIKTIDNEKKYYYNITKQSSLEHLLETKQVSLELIETILVQIFQVIETAKDFLLDERNLALETKMIYLSTSYPKTVEICYYPSYQRDSMEQMIGLLEVFLNQIDYKKEEKKKIEQFYRIYDKARETGMTCKELWKEIKKEYNQIENRIEEQYPICDRKPEYEFEKERETEQQKKSYEKSKPFHFERIEPVKKETKENIGFIEEKDIQKKESNKKQETKKSDIWNHNITKQKTKNAIPIRTMLTLCFIIAFSCIIIGTGLFTNIFRDTVTGTLEYSKIGILCIIVAIMDLFAWKYLKPSEQEAEQLSNNQKKESGLIENEFWKKETENLLFYTEPKQEQESIEAEKQKNIEWEMKKNIEKLSEKLEQSDEWKSEDIEQMDGTQILIEEPTMLLEQEQTMLLKTKDKRWRLVSLKEDEKQEIPLKKFPFYLGKLQWNVDYAIDHPSISRIHSKFEKEGDVLYMTDLDSTNGTYLNHIKIAKDEKQEVREGDEISFADMKFRLELENS